MGVWTASEADFVMPEGLDGRRRSWDPDGLLGGLPAYLDGLAQYGVRQLTGATYGPASGDEVLADVVPAVAGNNWAAASAPTYASTSLRAWNSGVAITSGDTGTRSLVFNVGGHADAAFNGLFQYDFTPDPGERPEGMALLSGSLSDIDDIGATGSNWETYSDGRPGARHSYDCLCYDETTRRIFLIGASALYHQGGISHAVWYFDLDTNTWTNQGNMDSGLGSGTAAVIIHDPVERKVLFFRAGQYKYAFLNLATLTWGTSKFLSNQGANDVLPTEGAAIYDISRSRAIIIGEQSARILNWSIDWTAETVTQDTNLTLTGANASEIIRRGVSGFRHPTRDSYLIWGGDTVTAGNATTYSYLYEIDCADVVSTPGAVPVTRHALGSALTTASMRGSWKRFAFVDEWDAIIFISDHDQAPYAITLTNRS